MPAALTCSQCGAPLPETTPGGRCPRCLLQLGLEDSGGASASEKTVTLPKPDFVIEETGTMIGRYKLLQQIGEGGFGVVFMAEQTEPVQRKLALKIIKAGMDTREVIGRFEAERQALALMDHPNIAQVFDGGATVSGRPYFVMELVRGLAITAYCDEAKLSTRQRLELFVKVCRAVQHAHQKAVIHRDLKPNNVLVTLHDGEPVPKVIDFGVAKALGKKLTDKTFFTRFEHMIGTPAYMSPEQAALSSLDVDTRSDIYSLGVLLYELLTGVTPLDAETLRQGALDEIRRIIRETDPPKPSTRLLTLGEGLAEVAKRRHAEPAALCRLVRGDLDWITMKAMEKDRQRRYETVNGLAADIERHLHDQPVVARSPGRMYRFQKMVRRNQAVFFAATAVTTALILGLGLSTSLFLKERAEHQRAVAAEQNQARLRREAETARASEADHRRQAEEARTREAKLRVQAEADEEKAVSEAAKSRQVAQFLEEMLRNVGPSVALGRDTALLRDILDKTTERLRTELKDQPAVEAELRTTLGYVYWDLSQYPKAEIMYREALALRRKLLGDQHLDVAYSLSTLGNVLWAEGRLAEAEATQRESLALQKKLLGTEHPDVAGTLTALGIVLGSEGKLEEAEAMHREALAIKRTVFDEQSDSVGYSLYNLAAVLANLGKRTEAETIYRELLTQQRKRPEQTPALGHMLNTLAGLLRSEGRLAEAEAMCREGLELRRQLLGEHLDVAHSLNLLSLTLRDQGRLAEAEVAEREVLAIRRKLLGKEHRDIATSLGDLARLLREQGKIAEADSLQRESLAGDEASRRDSLANARKTWAEDPEKWVSSLNNLVDVLQREGKHPEIEQLFKELAPATEGGPGNAGLLRSRATFRARCGRWQEAAADFSRLVVLQPENHDGYHCLAPLLVRTGDLEGYRHHCAQVLTRFGPTQNPFIAERMAKDCLILPSSGVDLGAVAQMAETAIAVGKTNYYLYYFQFAKGLAEHRQGHFSAAREWIEKMLPRAGGVPFLDAEAHLVLAMTQQQLKHENEARAKLAKGVQIVETKLPRLDSGDMGPSWTDWIIAHTLMDEAKALIEGGSRPVGERN